MALQHIRSSTLDKRPQPASLSDGQLAINTNLNAPGVFFKDSNGALVKVGPTFVGTTAPNSTPGSGGATGNTLGEQWLDTSGGTYVLKIWDGTAWRSEAGEFVNVTGDTMTGALVMDNQQQVRFRETTANGTNYIALQAPASVASDKTITLPDVTGTVVTTGDTGSVTSTMIADGTIVNGDVNASAAIAGTKISPDFGSQNVTTTGTVTGASLNPTSSTVPTNGVYLPAANSVGISTNGTGRLFVDSNGRIGVGTSSPSNTLHVVGTGRFNVSGANNAVIASDGGDPFFYTEQAAGLKFGTNSAVRMTINSSGSVGIGTTSPGAPLHVVAGTNARGIRISAVQNNSAAYLTFNDDLQNETAFIGNETRTGTAGQLVFGANGSERARIDSSGRLLVGTSTARTNTFNGAVSQALQIEGTNDTGRGAAIFSSLNSPDGSYFVLGHQRSGTIGGNTILNNADEFGLISFQGNDGSEFVEGARITAAVDGTPGANDMPGRLVFSVTADGASSPTERMRISQDGSISMSSRSITIRDGSGATTRTLELGSNASAGGNSQSNILLATYGGSYGARIRGSGNYDFNGGASLSFATASTAGVLTDRMSIDAAGAVAIVGSLSKGSGSFKISHPLPDKTNTHYLVHSFIEGPQADLIYRGHTALVDGVATVNIDEEARMTKGTFEALCNNVCCFTSNETDWTAVRGKVVGNVLTIEAQDPTSTAEVCWMVIGERKDKHMLETEWTDENGRVITEPLKPVESSEVN